MGVFQDLMKGNFSAVISDFEKGFAKLPSPVQAYVVKVENDVEGLLVGLAKTAFQDVMTGGFSTASFVAAGKDIVAKGLAQGYTILMSDAMAMLNMLYSEYVTNTTTSSTTASTTPVDTSTTASTVSA